MEKKRRIIIAVLLMLSIGNLARLTGNENIRPIQFISIFVIGALSALLINEFVTLFKAKRE
jgi:TM2 domain-containing membrane protein YozV